MPAPFQQQPTKLRPYQQQIVADCRAAYRHGHNAVAVQLATGGGKCLGRGTPVMMFDGRRKKVEQVQPGDLLMGPDSHPREVLSTCNGREMLYRVTPTKGDPYIVNESHILSLRLTSGGFSATSNPGRDGGRHPGQVINLSVRDYLSRSDWFRHIAKGWRTGIDFAPADPLSVDPYFLGLWLGDGSRRHVTITTEDATIVEWIEQYASHLGLRVRKEWQGGGKCPSYHIAQTECRIGINHRHPIIKALDQFRLRAEKHIPMPFKTASRTDRLSLLAGLIDSDGHLSKNGHYDFVFKSQRLAEDVVFLARSLGFAAYLKPCKKTCCNNGVTGDYWRFSITGDVDQIPVLLERKRSGPRRQRKNVLNVGIKVEPIGEGDYFGFEISGDRLFLLGDFTVTHNTVLGSFMVHGAASRGRCCWWLVHRRELLKQASQTFYGMGIDHGFIAGGRSSDPSRRVQIGSVQTVARRLDTLPPPDLIVFDEAHHLGAAQWQSIFDAYPAALKLGLTATPWRLDGKGLGQWFGTMVQGPAVADLVEAGSLSRYRLFAPSAPDVSSVKTAMGDFRNRDLASLMDKPSITGDAVQHYRRLAAGRRAVAFAVSIEHSRHVVDQFRANGIAAEHVDGQMGHDERDAAIARFVAGETLVLANADLLGEGFDVPAIEAAILLRPTQSLSLYLQQIGRALRPAPGKTEAIILDHAGNSIRHGLPDDDREWTLEDREKRRKSNDEASLAVRQCPKCFRVYRPAPACPGCGHAPPSLAREVEQKDGVLAEVDATAIKAQRKHEERRAQTVDDLIALGRSRGYKHPEGWARKFHAARSSMQYRYRSGERT